MKYKAVRGRLLHFIAQDKPEYFNDGLLVTDADSGTVVACGEAAALLDQYPDISVTQYDNALIMPGLIDTHIHYPQVDVIASYGEQLLDWLNNYTFPTEVNFADPAVATDAAEFFLN